MDRTGHQATPRRGGVSHPLLLRAVFWQLEEVQELLWADGTRQGVSDQCQCGHETDDGHPVKKPTRWLGKAGKWTRPGGGSHVVASGKVAREAAVYPLKLCRDILKRCVGQLRAEGGLQPGMHGAQGLWEEAADDVLGMSGRWTPTSKPVTDSVTGPAFF